MISPIYGESCLDYINKPVILGANLVHNLSQSFRFYCGYESTWQEPFWYEFAYGYSADQFDHTGRLIGWLTGEKDAIGNPQIAILGNGTMRYNKKFASAGINGRSRFGIVDGKADAQAKPITYEGTGTTLFLALNSTANPEPYTLPEINQVWLEQSASNNQESPTLYYAKYQQGTTPSYITTYNLTSDYLNTLVLGCAHTVQYADMEFWFTAPEYNDITYFNGMLAGECNGINAVGAGFINGKTREQIAANPYILCQPITVGHKYDHNLRPFNLLLTESKEQAMRYIDDGTLPSDVFLYPFDTENIPTYSDDDTDDGGDDDNENGETPDDIDDTPLVNPLNTPSSLTNNNLYWIQGGELADFMDWFWTEAGDIGDLEDLWHKIEGLYNNLGAAIINVRYMPVNPAWIGGYSTAAGIVVGQIIKEGNVNKLNNATPVPQTIGTIHVGEKFKAFTDYSPYCECKLYLPYHGFIDIDIDLLMKQDLTVKAVYDHISGTIQYFVFRNNTLINSCVAKMCVDIPITLQSKNDRDSAIFQNVGSGVASLIGAGVSAATKSPIGLVMSTANLASGGAQSAPFAVRGTVEETGAFYAPNKCAIYISRPRYNRPALYDSRVGFPLNKNYQLGKISGFTTVYNPYIDFSGNSNADSVKQYPLSKEIDEIYEYLEKGVIL